MPIHKFHLPSLLMDEKKKISKLSKRSPVMIAGYVQNSILLANYL